MVSDALFGVTGGWELRCGLEGTLFFAADQVSKKQFQKALHTIICEVCTAVFVQHPAQQCDLACGKRKDLAAERRAGGIDGRTERDG